MSKVCPRCKNEQSYDNFYKNRKLDDGLNFYCINCIKTKKQERLHNRNDVLNYNSFNKLFLNCYIYSCNSLNKILSFLIEPSFENFNKMLSISIPWFICKIKYIE